MQAVDSAHTTSVASQRMLDSCRWTQLLGCWALCAVSSGCVAIIPYEYNSAHLEGLDAGVAEEAFEALIANAARPRISYADVEDEYYEFQTEQVIHGAYGVPTGSTGTKFRVEFTTVGEVRIYENDVVYVLNTDSSFVHLIQFAKQDDAKRFADFVMSYRARVMPDDFESESESESDSDSASASISASESP